MTTALAVDSTEPGRSQLMADLQAVGLHVLGAPASHNMVREATARVPDVVIVRDESPGAELMSQCRRLMDVAPCPIVVFTADPDADKIAEAMDVGIASYVVGGYHRTRLRALIQVAQARFKREQAMREALADVQHRFEERKLVDKAKGILMRARQLSEEEAFRALRTASMHSHRRVGQVSQQVIDASRYAEAVNRAGQLRAMSQRLVKAYALRVLQVEPAPTARLMAETVHRIETLIDGLCKRVSASTFGDLIDAVVAVWEGLKASIALPIASTRMAEVDACAEQLLMRAEQLTQNLENSGLVTSLQVINLSGRQRMLSQRLAKLALLSLLLPSDPAEADYREMTDVISKFEAAQGALIALPLITREIRELHGEAAARWAELRQACRRREAPGGAAEIGDASEALLAISQKLTDEYERSMQVLMG